MTKDVTYDPKLPVIKLDGYDLSGRPELILQNNGHTCKSVHLFTSYLEICVTMVQTNPNCVCVSILFSFH